MRVLLFGKTRGVGHLAEDIAEDLRLAGHDVSVFAWRGNKLRKLLEPVLMAPSLGVPLAVLLARAVRRFRPDLIVALGPFHWLPPAIFAPLSAMPGRPPMVAWVGDRFSAEEAQSANLFDVVAYTDSGLLAMHETHGFHSGALFLPLGANRGARARQAGSPEGSPEGSPGVSNGGSVDERPVFVASATPGRRALLRSVREQIVLAGPDWRATEELSHHHRDARRVPPRALPGIYVRHASVLNIRHEENVIHGLNQRHFAPCVVGTAVLSDAVADLSCCFEPGSEMQVYQDAAGLDDLIARGRREPAVLRLVAAAGRRRVLAEHTYAHRLEAMARAAGVAVPVSRRGALSPHLM